MAKSKTREAWSDYTEHQRLGEAEKLESALQKNQACISEEKRLSNALSAFRERKENIETELERLRVAAIENSETRKNERRRAVEAEGFAREILGLATHSVPHALRKLEQLVQQYISDEV